MTWTAQHIGNTGGDYGYGITSLSDGCAIVTGSFQGTASFGDTTLTSAGEEDVFIAKLNVDGSYAWATKAGGSYSEFDAGFGNNITSLSDGSSIVTGSFYGTASFGDTTLTSAGGYDAFIAKLNADGSFFSYTDIDTTAPTLISYELSSYNLDLSNGDVTIDVTAQITDDISGVFDGTYANGSGGSASQARWRSPSGNQFLDAGYFSSPSTGDFLDGTYKDQTVLGAEHTAAKRQFYIHQKTLKHQPKSHISRTTKKKKMGDVAVSSKAKNMQIMHRTTKYEGKSKNLIKQCDSCPQEER